MTQAELISTSAAAAALGLDRRTVLRLIERGELPAEKLPGRTAPYVLERSRVEALVEKRATPEGVTR